MTILQLSFFLALLTLVHLVIYSFNFHHTVLFMIQEYIYILPLLYKPLYLHPFNLPLDTSTNTSSVQSIHLHRPCTYCKRCGLEYALHFLFLWCFHGPGKTCSTNATAFQTQSTVPPMFLLSLPPHTRPLREVLLPWPPLPLNKLY